MKVLSEPDNNIFPMKVKCRVPKQGTLAFYGKEIDYCGRELEIEAADIKKYRTRNGADYGVFCPGCGRFVVIPEENIPGYVKAEAQEVMVTPSGCVITEIPEQKQEQAFVFMFTDNESVKAGSLNDALRKFKAAHPGADIKGIKPEEGNPVSYMFSLKTSEKIWYRSGCRHGYSDCILDPMRDVAKECRTQDELTEDRQRPCTYHKLL